jgi:uncharacterized protein (TIGR03435 family)
MRTLLTLAFAFQLSSFDVASIKPSEGPTPGRSRGNTVRDDRLDYQVATLRYCIAYAYGVKEYQVNGSAWLAEDRWDIQAKAPEGATRDRFPGMLQALLAERFHLQVHREKKDFDGLAMVIGKNGPKLERAAAPATFSTSMSFRGGGKIDAKGMTMATLAGMLTQTLARPVADETNLEGPYAFTLEYAAYEARGGMQIRITGGDPLPPPPADADPGTSVFSSIQKLGLKLESRKVPLEVIVVDHVDKTPTAN